MKPSKRQDAPKGPERGQGGGERGPEKDPAERESGDGDAQRQRLEKEREILSPETQNRPDRDQGKSEGSEEDS